MHIIIDYIIVALAW